MPTDQAFIPITIDEVVEAVRGGAWLCRAHITNLRGVLEALGRECRGRTLTCVNCAVDGALCREMEIGVELDFGAGSRTGLEEAERSVFLGDVDFSRASFAYPIHLRGAFRGAVKFERTRFAERTSFSDAIFYGSADFQSSHFGHEALFVMTLFEKTANFTGTTFDRTAQVSGAGFRRDADFSSATFKDSAVFLATRFIRAIFFGASFGGMTQFVGAFVRDTLILEFCRIHSTMDLNVDSERHTVRGRGWLNLADVDRAVGGRILLSMELIGRTQWPIWWARRGHFGWKLPGPLRRRYLRFQRWLHRKVPSVCLVEGEDANDPVRLRAAAAQYNMLRDNFREMPSKEEEEDRCHYKFKDLTRRSWRSNPAWVVWDWAIMKWCLGYGIYTRRILATGVGVILGFSLVYEIAVGSEHHWLIRGFDNNFNALYFSMITFTTIGYGDYAPRGILRFFAGVEGLLGMVLISVFTVSFARKLIR